MCIFKNYQVTIQLGAALELPYEVLYLKTTKLLFNPHQTKLHFLFFHL